MELQVVDLTRYDYVIVGCGYIQRLMRHTDKIIEECIEANGGHPFMFFYLGGNSISIVQDDSDGVLAAFSQMREKIGETEQSVCLKENACDIGCVMDSLRRCKHCACWGDRPIRVVSFIYNWQKGLV